MYWCFDFSDASCPLDVSNYDNNNITSNSSNNSNTAVMMMIRSSAAATHPPLPPSQQQHSCNSNVNSSDQSFHAVSHASGKSDDNQHRSEPFLFFLSNLTGSAKCATREDDYTLIQSQVIFRHGARTPVVVIPNVTEVRYDKRIFGAVLSHTDFDYDLLDLSGAKAEGLLTSPMNARYEKGILEGGSKRGQLTTVGMQQCYELGLTLRRRYMLKYKLIGEQYDDRQVYLRSTFMQRTLDTLQGVVAGLYGVDHLYIKRPKFHIDYHTEEILYPNDKACKCLKEISEHGADHLKDLPKYAALAKRVEKAIGHDPSHMRRLYMFLVRQDLMCRHTHGRALPSELAPYFDELNQHAPMEYLQALSGKTEDRAAGLRLGVGRFHDLILSNMDGAIKGADKPKLSLYASHDSMMIPLLVSLGCYDWVWPGYTSNIAYELWKHRKTGRFFAKVLYNGEEQKIAKQTDTMIPYEEFKKILAPFTLSPAEYKYMCEHTRASIEAPPVEYSLHYDDKKLEGGDITTDEGVLPVN